MSKPKASVVSMIAAATMAIAIAWTVTQINSLPAPVATHVRGSHATKPTWAASAAGRVEPRGGEIKIGAQTAGRIADIAVKINDVVETGDLLIRLDDEEATRALRRPKPRRPCASAREMPRRCLDRRKIGEMRRMPSPPPSVRWHRRGPIWTRTVRNRIDGGSANNRPNGVARRRQSCAGQTCAGARCATSRSAHGRNTSANTT